MLRGTAFPDRAVSPAPANLRGALCAGDSMFTREGLGRRWTAELLAVCARCPVLTACTEDRDLWRRAHPLDWQQFTGVWAGQAFARGRAISVQTGGGR